MNGPFCLRGAGVEQATSADLRVGGEPDPFCDGSSRGGEEMFAEDFAGRIQPFEAAAAARYPDIDIATPLAKRARRLSSCGRAVFARLSLHVLDKAGQLGQFLRVFRLGHSSRVGAPVAA